MATRLMDRGRYLSHFDEVIFPGIWRICLVIAKYSEAHLVNLYVDCMLYIDLYSQRTLFIHIFHHSTTQAHACNPMACIDYVFLSERSVDRSDLLLHLFCAF